MSQREEQTRPSKLSEVDLLTGMSSDSFLLGSQTVEQNIVYYHIQDRLIQDSSSRAINTLNSRTNIQPLYIQPKHACSPIGHIDAER